jgi:hypothetical protein
MSDSIIDGTNMNTQIFSYSEPKAHASGGKVVNLYNKLSKESLTISTPLILTWGAQEGMDQQKNPTGKFTMSLQFPNSDFPNQDCQAFLDGMRQLENAVKTAAMENSKKWFGKQITSMDVMDEKFNVMLRHPKVKGSQEPDLSKAPTLTVKIPCWSGIWKPEIYDEEGTPLYINGKVNSHLSPLEYLKPKTHVICLLQCGGLWFVNGKVSITWNLKQAIVQKPKPSMEGQCFLKPKAADKALLKALPPVEVIEEPDDGQVSTLVVDSDDEADVILPPTPVSVPVLTTPVAQETVVQEEIVEDLKPAAAKKKVIRKKTDA